MSALTAVLARVGRPKPDRRAARRSLPIHAYVGANGGGKTACMVWDTLPTLAAGRPVLSTVRLLDFEDPRPCEDAGCTHPEHDTADDEHPVTHLAAHPLWVPFTDWRQLLDAERCDVLMDEVTGVASSRDSHAMPGAVLNRLVQLRRADVTVRWSSPAWMRADKVIRETSQGVTYCRGFFPVSVVEDEDRLWRQRRLFRWSTYDPAEFEDFTAGKREQLSPIVRDWFYGPGSPVFQAYDTYDAVLSIGTVSETGVCMTCDGSRRRHDCSCPDYVHRRLDAKDAAAAAARARAEPEHAAAEDDPADQSGSLLRLRI